MNIPDYYILQQQCDSITIDDSTMPYMKSLYSCLNRVKGDGYIEDFENTLQGIHSITSDHHYLPEEFKIINFFRFEGNDKVGGNVVMYMIETMDGTKGTLLNNYDAANDRKSVSPFMNIGSKLA